MSKKITLIAIVSTLLIFSIYLINMILTKQDIEKYKQIYFEKYGEEISDEEAYRQGIALLGLIKIAMGNDDLVE